MFTFVVLTLLVLGQLVVGLLLFLESQRTKRMDQRIFAGLSFLLVVWIIAVGSLTGIDADGAANRELYFTTVNCLAFSLSCGAVMLVYLFGQYYPLRRKPDTLRKVILGSGITLAILSPIPLISGDLVPNGPNLLYEYGPLAPIVALYAVFAVGTLYIQEGGILRRSHDAKLRQQTITLLAGMTLTVLHVVVFVILLPTIWGQSPLFYAIGYAAPYYLTIFTGYGLLRQGLFDIRAIVARSLAYLLSVLIAALLFITPVVLISTYLLGEHLSIRTILAIVAVTLVIAFLFQPLKNYFNRVTNRYFYRDYYDPQDVLDKLGSLLVGTVDTNEILRNGSSILLESVKPASVEFLLFADTKKHDEVRLLHRLEGIQTNVIVTEEISADGELLALLRKKEVAVAIRLRTSHELIGYMLLGTRRSGDGYSNNDRRLLGVAADELALGIQNSLRFREIEKFNATLQDKIEEATRKLRRTNDKLRTLDQTKDDFISMASHQLRTPLTSVKGYVSMVLEGDAGKINPMQRKLLNQAFISSQRMVYLISDLLNVSRLRTGKFIIEPIRTNLANVIKGEIDQLVETAKSRNLELVYAKPEHFPTYMLDETKLRQVIMNFVDNAIYYTPSGGRITVSLVEKTQSIEFSVSDTGMGVPKHEQPHLFTKFFRAYNARRARPDGTGLGLFMAKKVIIAQGGAIMFKSQEGKGSTFGFTFAKSALQLAAKDPVAE
jgi:signal transduction histidine kinase